MRNLGKSSAGLALFLAVAGSVGAVKAEVLRIGTASLGSASHPMGQAVANLVTKHSGAYTMVPVVTQGATGNLWLIAGGKVDIAIGNASSPCFAFKGTNPYPEALNIRSVGTLHDSVLQIVTLGEAKVKSIGDLKGERVAVGPARGHHLAHAD